MIIKRLIKDKYLRALAILSIFILFLAALIFYLKLGSITTPLIIHFNASKGIDFLGGGAEIWGIIILALAMIIINLFLADFLYFRERFLSYIFGFGNLGLAILILIVVAIIISVNQ